MKRKGLMILLAAALLLRLLPGSAPAASAMSGEYVIMTATDLHFLAPELTDHGSYFWKVMDNSDGRVTEYCEEITDAFLAQVIRQAPDALVLTGDISFNGARASHISLAAKLADVEAAGIPVFVLPGNHDVYRGTAAAFFGDGYELMPGVSGEEFAEIYGEFGFDEALSRDQDSLSYVSRLNDSTWLLMLDANTLHDYCSLSQKTLAWTREQLEAARLGGVGVLAACHQNLYQHSVFRGGYMLACSEQLHDLLEEYQVPLILSGHMHIQHIKTEGSVTEIAGSPLTLGDCLYGILQCAEGELRYEARPVQVSAWASERELADENLRSFESYARERFNRRTDIQAREQLTKAGIEGDEAEELVKFACALNSAYFGGDLTGIPELDRDGTLLLRWKESGTMFGGYLASLEEEIGKDYRSWEGAG